MKFSEIIDEDLRQWFRAKWVDISRKEGGKHPACGASAGEGKRKSDPQHGYPKCVPAAKARTMSKAEKKSAADRKRRVERKPEARKKTPDFVRTDKD